MSMLWSRREVLTAVIWAPVVPATTAWLQSTAMTVYKDPSCGCCGKWVEHMVAAGFKASVIEGDMAPVHARFKIPANLQSCHTAFIEGYLIEGHVPAADVRRLLAEKPKAIRGLTIPGMPASAPGMDLKPFRPYDVLSFDDRGQTRIVKRYTNG